MSERPAVEGLPRGQLVSHRYFIDGTRRPREGQGSTVVTQQAGYWAILQTQALWHLGLDLVLLALGGVRDGQEPAPQCLRGGPAALPGGWELAWVAPSRRTTSF